jgi:hypothetical protein
VKGSKFNALLLPNMFNMNEQSQMQSYVRGGAQLSGYSQTQAMPEERLVAAPPRRAMWPMAIVTLGFALSLTWTGFLLFVLYRIIEEAL